MSQLPYKTQKFSENRSEKYLWLLQRTQVSIAYASISTSVAGLLRLQAKAVIDVIERLINPFAYSHLY